MIEKLLTLLSKTFDGFGDDVSEKVVTMLREDRRERWRQASRQMLQVLMLIGAVSGLLTLVIALWELLR
jgi:hypothetical protein